MKIHYINHFNEKITLTDSEFHTLSVNGVTPFTAIKSRENAFSAGADYISEHIMQRNITLVVYSEGDIDEAREKLCRVFRTGGEGTLYFDYGNGSTRTIKCRPESMPAPLKERPGTMQISLLCLDPFFEDARSTSVQVCGERGLWEFDWEFTDNFEFGTIKEDESTLVVNDGAYPAGCIIKINIRTGTVEGLKITNHDTNEYIALSGAYTVGDQITIDTRSKHKSVTLLSSGSIVPRNIISRFIWGSSFFELPSGNSRISARSDNGISGIDVNIYFSERYESI